ncbi:MAG: hypothetical protein ABIR70_00915 [Bryobacteraceae bacterium]
MRGFRWIITATLLSQSLGFAAALQSAEALAFGPNGVLFVGDSMAGAVVALETGDRTPRVASPSVLLDGIDQKIAALLGTKPSEIRFNDIKVNPSSKNIYIAVARGRGPDAIPVLLRIDGAGTITEVDTARMAATRVNLPGLPDSPVARRRTGSRALAITELQYSDGRLIVAGLSNEDFSSTLRVVPFPFTKADRGASISIYHTSHFTYETNAPVRTMVPYTHNGEQFLLAAYTCTPLVRLRLSDLKDGTQITGETLAELGRHSSPTDMIQYTRNGQDYLLVSNTLNGVLRLSLAGFDTFEAVDETGGNDAQVPIQRMGLKGVAQLDIYDDTRALMLFASKTRVDLRTVPLP